MRTGTRRELTSRIAATIILPVLCLSAFSAEFKVHPKTTETLRAIGYTTNDNGWLVDIKQPNRIIPTVVFGSQDLYYDEEGLFVDSSGAWISDEDLASRIARLTGMADRADDVFSMDPALAELLKKNGFTHDDEGQILHKKTGTLIPRERLFDIGLTYDSKGTLVYMMDFKRSQWGMKDLKAGRRVREDRIIPTLNGLMQYDEINALDDRKTGDALKAMKIPPAFDGAHLVNPDGTATYYGKMLYTGLRKTNTKASELSKEQLSKAIDGFKTAFGYSNGQPYAFAFSQTIQEGFDALKSKGPRSGEIPLELLADKTMSVSRLREQAEAYALNAASPQDRADIKETIKTLNAMERRYYHRDMDLRAVPGPALGEDKNSDVEHDKAPLLLATLRKIMPDRLTEGQTKALLWEMPMGETIVRMNAHKFWEKNLTGEGVKIGVIDAGAADNPELRDAVASRKEFINQAPVFAGFIPGEHGTHVSGTIHALAPDAEINSYDVFDEGGADDERIMAAVDAAVADGNHVINMSLGGMGSPSDDMVKLVEKHAKNGVIFNISAGNSGNERGIGAPSLAQDAYSIGAETVDGKMAEFSSYGRVYNPETLSYLYKKIYMAPGTNIVSTAGLGAEENDYRDMNGTSMAAPHATGADGLLVGALLKSPGMLNPVTMSEALRKALDKTAVPMDRSRMPQDVSEMQEVAVLDHWAALKELFPKF